MSEKSRKRHCSRKKRKGHHRSHRARHRSSWSALDACSRHPFAEAEITQNADQVSETTQVSAEAIVIKDSCDVEVSTTDTQAAVNLQVALQVLIALVISVSIGSSETANAITQDLLQKSQIKQVNTQRTIIENSRGVRVTTTDTDVAVNIQLLAQVLAALVARLNIL
ncbi:spore coat protein [Aneurinibacillus tyrosinisolvens]|uniref:spore coat protein n=1 Tax=Aneurinibacillus tyrosinisolvens TaxID=1443435 RepID=UPI00063F2EB0|nr:spore coat protein [Aneurinibacillus tyrosinisolvens]